MSMWGPVDPVKKAEVDAMLAELAEHLREHPVVLTDEQIAEMRKRAEEAAAPYRRRGISDQTWFMVLD